MNEGDGSARPSVEIDGQPLPPELEPVLELVQVDQDVHLADAFAITFRDLDRTVLERAKVKIGSTIRISGTELGGPQPSLLMAGEVTAIEADYHPRGSRATVRGYDHSHRLSRGRRSDTYRNVKDSDIAQVLAKRASLQIGTIDDSGTVHEHVSQANLSDWEFLRGRARKIGFEVVVMDGAFHFRKLKAATDAPSEGDYASTNPLQLVFGQGLLEFRPRVTASGQVSEVQVRSWDPATKKVLLGSAKAATASASLRAAPGDLARTFGSPVHVTVDKPVSTADEAQKVASALAEHISSAFAEADGVARGHPRLAAGAAVSISVVSGDFEGRYTLTHTRHVFDAEGYRTQFVISGRQERSLLGLASMGATAGVADSGPPIPGVVVAIVTGNDDPLQQGRVKLRFPWLSDGYESMWARMTQVGAGPDSGAVFLPEVGDEVLVAFEFGDINRPYVVGSIHNGVDKPRLGNDLFDNGKVKRRGFVSRRGHRVVFFDGDNKSGVAILSADGKLKLALDETNGEVHVASGGSVIVEAGSDMTLQAGGTLTIKAGRGLKIQSDAMVEVSGKLIKLN